MTSNEILFYSQISASFICSQRNVILQQIKNKYRDSQTDIYMREKEGERERNFEIQRPIYNVPIKSISSEPTKPSERRGRKSIREGMEDTQKARSTKLTEQSLCKFTERVPACTMPAGTIFIESSEYLLPLSIQCSVGLLSGRTGQSLIYVPSLVLFSMC